MAKDHSNDPPLYGSPSQGALQMSRAAPASPRPHNPEMVGREMKEHELASPVDISDLPIDRGDSLRWSGLTIATAALVLLFANAGTLSGWIDEKDPTPLQQRASGVASSWTTAMDKIGFTAPRRKLHDGWKKLQAARFGGEAPGASQ